ncbi:UNVERIFIED_CONTAM: hypothetical protein RMT77_013150 [Armadillidium vulgare]
MDMESDVDRSEEPQASIPHIFKSQQKLSYMYHLGAFWDKLFIEEKEPTEYDRIRKKYEETIDNDLAGENELMMVRASTLSIPASIIKSKLLILRIEGITIQKLINHGKRIFQLEQKIMAVDRFRRSGAQTMNVQLPNQSCQQRFPSTSKEGVQPCQTVEASRGPATQPLNVHLQSQPCQQRFPSTSKEGVQPCQTMEASRGPATQPLNVHLLSQPCQSYFPSTSKEGVQPCQSYFPSTSIEGVQSCQTVEASRGPATQPLNVHLQSQSCQSYFPSTSKEGVQPCQAMEASRGPATQPLNVHLQSQPCQSYFPSTSKKSAQSCQAMEVSRESATLPLNDQVLSQPCQPCFSSTSKESTQFHPAVGLSLGPATKPLVIQVPSEPCQPCHPSITKGGTQTHQTMNVSKGSATQILNHQLEPQPYQPCFPSTSKDAQQHLQAMKVSRGSATQLLNVQLPFQPYQQCSPSTYKDVTSQDDKPSTSKEGVQPPHQAVYTEKDIFKSDETRALKEFLSPKPQQEPRSKIEQDELMRKYNRRRAEVAQARNDLSAMAREGTMHEDDIVTEENMYTIRKGIKLTIPMYLLNLDNVIQAIDVAASKTLDAHEHYILHLERRILASDVTYPPASQLLNDQLPPRPS